YIRKAGWVMVAIPAVLLLVGGNRALFFTTAPIPGRGRLPILCEHVRNAASDRFVFLFALSQFHQRFFLDENSGPISASFCPIDSRDCNGGGCNVLIGFP